MFEKVECTAYAEFDLCADGPVLVSSGKSNKTNPTLPDNTFMTGFCGAEHKDEMYVIPGSTIKGIFRHSIDEHTAFGIFGSKGERCNNNFYPMQKSKIKFNDAFAVPDSVVTTIRYSTAINPAKQSPAYNSLNNMAVIEKGTFKAGFIFKNYTEAEMEKILLALYDVNEGTVRFGGKISRGFGKMRVENFSMKVNNGFDENLTPKLEIVFSSIDAAYKHFRKAE
ncbi:MAG: hypothetical protein J6A05_00645 [Oscillospiraceae bacterium]|nr:hypothetical protein [Oscillospiraceae bacterium]